MMPDTRIFRVEFPAATMRPGFNEIGFRYAWTASPRSTGAADDDRELALQCDTISLIRQG